MLGTLKFVIWVREKKNDLFGMNILSQQPISDCRNAKNNFNSIYIDDLIGSCFEEWKLPSENTQMEIFYSEFGFLFPLN